MSTRLHQRQKSVTGISHPSPTPAPERAIYGFVLFLASLVAGGIYLVWALVPPEYLNNIGIDFLPDRYWAIVVPLSICSLVIFIPIFYGLLCLRMMPDGGLEHLTVDDHSRVSIQRACSHRSTEGIPPLYDLPFDADHAKTDDEL